MKHKDITKKELLIIALIIALCVLPFALLIGFWFSAEHEKGFFFNGDGRYHNQQEWLDSYKSGCMAKASRQSKSPILYCDVGGDTAGYGAYVKCICHDDNGEFSFDYY